MTEPADRDRLRQLLSSPTSRSASPPPGLAACSPDALVYLILDGEEPWWRRQVCARALAGRVPAERAMALLDGIRDPGVTTEIRAALLAVLSAASGPHTDELLAWLRAQERRLGDPNQPHGLDEAILRARGRMGDTSAAVPLATLAADPWSHRRRVGEQAIEALIQLRGLPAVLAALGVDSRRALAISADSPAQRLLGLRLEHRAGADITSSLADTSTMVARKAYELLAETGGDAAALVDLVDQRRPGHLWALAVLHRRGHPIRDRWEALGPPRVELPGVPADVRRAIARAYTPGQRDTDPRWLLEAACLEEPDRPDQQELGQRATGALTAAGLHPQEPVSVGEAQQQGKGTYYIIRTSAGELWVSTLGPFFHPARSAGARVVTAMRRAGFQHIDAELGRTRFDGLHVYFFGAREPLSVRDLLFYWQD
jgi:hypothetical protein